MAARKTQRRRDSGKSSRRNSARDAIALLRADHERVKEMFGRFENVRGRDRKENLVEQICLELQVHTAIEEEIFYPAVREAIDDADLMDEALVEHQSAKDLIAQLQSTSAGDDLYDARVTVLGEYVLHHVKEEQGEMFPKARKAGLDLRALGERMQERKAQLMSESPIGTLRRLAL
jgi:hemerythrin superfamily protein